MLEKSHKIVGGLLLTGSLAVGGCASHQASARGNLNSQLSQKTEKVTTLENALKDKDARMGSLENALAQRDAKLKEEYAAVRKAEMEAQQARQRADQARLQADQARAQAEEARRRERAIPTTVTASNGDPLLPPNAKPGACYARVFIPPEYRNETERVRVREASYRIETAPARFETVEETVMVRAASERLEVVPATYKWIEEKVLVKPASQQVRDIPPVYETVTERVLDRPAHTVWKKGRGPIERVDAATGEIMCLVEVPASYKTVTKRVLKTPATTQVVDVPAQYRTVKRRVMDTPPTTRKVVIPAEYRTVKVQKLVTPPQEKRIPIPEQYETVTKTIKASEGRMGWRPILCETNITPDIISDIQEALLEKGHNPGPIDGVLGRQTMDAVKSFQQEKGLPQAGLSINTLKQLGVNVGDAI